MKKFIFLLIIFFSLNECAIAATVILRPNAVGDETALQQYARGGNNYDKVDEETPDEDATYVWSSFFVVDRDLYNLPAHSGEGTINKVTVYVRCKEVGDLPGRHWCRTVLKTHNVVYESANKNIARSYTNYSEEYTTNPYTNAAWAWDEINALQIGVKLSDGSDERIVFWVCCTQVYLEVDYVPYIDVGIRVRTSSGTTKVGAQNLKSSHKLRIRKGNTTYGIPLVATDDIYASPLRIYDGTEVKALPKME